MALRSMTGFGSGRAAAGGIKVEIELSSVNRKQADIRVTMSRQLAVLEPRIHEALHSRVSRGAVACVVNVVISGKARQGAVSVDMDVARGYVRALRKVGAELKLRDDLGIRSLVQLPDVVQSSAVPGDLERLWTLMKKALGQATDRLVKMRETEGKALARDLEQRFDAMRTMVAEIRSVAPAVTQKYRDALRQRIQAAGVDLPLDDGQLAREVALFADRCDISEELTRLDSHFGQVAGLRGSNEAAGRALDFLCQEIFREINTIGSKANDAGISQRVIRLKAELECIREKVQNVE